MKIYTSKYSFGVNVITIGFLVAMFMLIISLFAVNMGEGSIAGIIISVIIIVLILYFYTNSLTKIIIDQQKIVLKKPFGKIEIPLSKIVAVERLEFSNLSMTYGSKGVFGYIGNTMDNSQSFVKDRKNMIRIKTEKSSYTISTDQPNQLITDLRKVIGMDLQSES